MRLLAGNCVDVGLVFTMRPLISLASLEIPKGWDDFSTMTIVGPAAGGFRANVVVTAEASTAAPPDYAQRQLKLLAAEAKAFKKINGGPSTIGGQVAETIDFSFKDDSGRVLRQRHIYVQVAERMITISCTHLDREFEQAEGLFAEVTQSIRFS
jgi:hypothetical protein